MFPLLRKVQKYIISTYLTDIEQMDQDTLLEGIQHGVDIALVGIHLKVDMLLGIHLEVDILVVCIHQEVDMLVMVSIHKQVDMLVAGIHLEEGIQLVGNLMVVVVQTFQQVEDSNRKFVKTALCHLVLHHASFHHPSLA